MKTFTFLPAALCLVAAGCGGCYDSEPYTCTNAYHAHEIEHCLNLEKVDTFGSNTKSKNETKDTDTPGVQ